MNKTILIILMMLLNCGNNQFENIIKLKSCSFNILRTVDSLRNDTLSAKLLNGNCNNPVINIRLDIYLQIHKTFLDSFTLLLNTIPRQYWPKEVWGVFNIRENNLERVTGPELSLDSSFLISKSTSKEVNLFIKYVEWGSHRDSAEIVKSNNIYISNNLLLNTILKEKSVRSNLNILFNRIEKGIKQEYIIKKECARDAWLDISIHSGNNIVKIKENCGKLPVALSYMNLILPLINLITNNKTP
jgi:hypothetical protein